MSLATRAVATAALAAVVAVVGYLGTIPLALVAGLLTVVLAVGWPSLVGLPFSPGSSVVIGLAGLGGAAVVHDPHGDPDLRDLAIIFAGSVLLTFVNELLRRDGRPRLVESMAGTVTGSLLAVTAAGWVACGHSTQGEELVVAAAMALAVGSAISAVALPMWLTSTFVVLLATAAGAGLGLALPVLGWIAGGLTGLAVGVLVASMHALFQPLSALSQRLPALAAVVLPVCVGGMLVYIVGRVLLG